PEVSSGSSSDMKKVWLSLLVAALIGPAVQTARQAGPVYLDPAKPLDDRVGDLIGRLTLAEKMSLLGTTAPAIDRLEIPAMNGWNQSLHGIVWTEPTTMFPVPISMAATWNPALVHDIAAAIADEGRAIHNYWPTVPGKIEPTGGQGQSVTVAADGRRLRHNGLVYRSPVINISRDPRWGRIWEAFGEDPWLTSRMTVAYVKGTQGDDPKYLKLAATLKHYAVNNEERDRTKIDVTVSERMLREYFLPHFRAGIVEGKASSIMSSYNSINGTPGAEHEFLLKTLLRDEWKFEGFIVPDSGAVERLVTGHRKYSTFEEAAARTILVGSDLDNSAYVRYVPGAVAKGLLTERHVDQALGRVLRVRFRLGEFDPPERVPYKKLGKEDIDSATHRQLALRAARESIVLLSNRDNFLPLDAAAIKTIAVIGPFADFAQTGPNYTGLYSIFVKPLDGIKKRVGANTKVLYARGSGIIESDNPEASYAEAVSVAKQADVCVLFVGINEILEREGIDRNFINLPPVQSQLVRRVLEANPRTAIVLQNGGPVSLAGGGGPAAAQRPAAPAILDMFWAGEEGGTAIAEVLFGDYNPGGRLPYTVYQSVQDIPPMKEYDITKGFTYMYFDGAVDWAFGHGLSYTTFDYANLRITGTVPAGPLTVTADIRNTGTRAGDEVVQLYIRDVEASVKRPKAQLMGFERISLRPGETRAVSFTLSPDRLAFWDEKRKAWIVEPGAFEVMVGSSSADVRLRREITASSPGQWTPAQIMTMLPAGSRN
ncbi:MAG TPA: glycoside hydrolase family 3 C-terminal domain-containing protein, partial [Vicinamibacterales bacterium]|nr:glycoside hydrolase family 3 C-terminal domain-containing protein [Vicinamibacterales bacterium]